MSAEQAPVVSEESKEQEDAALSSAAAQTHAQPDLPADSAEKSDPTILAPEEADSNPASEPLADPHASLDTVPASSVTATEENSDFSGDKKGGEDAEAAQERSLGGEEEAAQRCGDDGGKAHQDGAAVGTEAKENGFEAPPEEADKQDESKGEEEQEEAPQKETEKPDESKEGGEGEGEGKADKEEPLNGDASYSVEGKEQEALPSSGVEKLFSRYTKLPFILTGLAIAAAGVALGSISRSSFLRNK